MRLFAPLLALALVLVGLIGYRLNAQAEALRGPSGGSGEIEGTTVDLSSRVGARVKEVLVQKGDRVTQGQTLMQLDCAEPEAQLAEAEARLESARSQAAAARVQIAASRRSQAAAQAAEQAAIAQTAALEAQKEASLRQAQRLESIPSDVPAATVDQTRATANGLGHQVEAARAQASATQAQKNAAAAGVEASSSAAEAMAAQVRAAEALVARMRVWVGECVIKAPRDAHVSELPRESGEVVMPGQVLLRLLDLRQTKATFYLPNAELSQVRPGSRAIVIADAWPGVEFAGTVRTVGVKAEFTPRNIQTRSDRDRLVYPIEVTVENKDEKLRAGMPVQVVLVGTGRP